MRMIRAGLSVGFFGLRNWRTFSANEMPEGAPCQRVRHASRQKNCLFLEAKLRDLQRWRRELRLDIERMGPVISCKLPRGKQARLLETLRHPKSHSERAARGIQKTESLMKLIFSDGVQYRSVSVKPETRSARALDARRSRPK